MLYRKKKRTDFWKGVAIFVGGELEVMLGIRFFLKMVQADPANGFVNFMYKATNPIVAPFKGIFTQDAVTQLSSIEFFTLFALVVYGLITFAVVAFIGLFEN